MNQALVVNSKIFIFESDDDQSNDKIKKSLFDNEYYDDNSNISELKQSELEMTSKTMIIPQEIKDKDAKQEMDDEASIESNIGSHVDIDDDELQTGL